tara:strand:- start:173 stop:541 length:369 start_codon:yes stop_codon:yes gene_type:complete
VQIYKLKWFDRWAKSEKLSDRSLLNAFNEMNAGLIDARLGKYIYKKRVAIAGKGKSSSLRTIVAFKSERRAVFIYGFSKSKQENITDKELKALKIFASEVIAYDQQKIENAIKIGTFIEVEI